MEHSQGNTLLRISRSFMPSNAHCWQDRLRPTQSQSKSYVQLLIEAGADLNAKNNDGLTPLMHGMKRGDLHKVRTIV